MTRRRLLLGFGGVTLLAQSRQERGKKVIKDALDALGGDKYLGMKDRIEAGRAYSFYNDRLSGLTHAKFYTRYLTRPEPSSPSFFGQRERQSFGKDKEDSAVLFTEREAWSVTFRGARPVGKDVDDRYRESTMRNIFYILRQRLGEPGLIIEHDATDVVDTQPVDIVTITDSENKSVKVFFHATTKLPHRQERVRRVDETKDRFDELSRFAKYRDVSGIQWPFQITRERNGDKIMEQFSESVTINTGLTDTLFALPSNTKILKKV
jgi:hypothetical protein